MQIALEQALAYELPYCEASFDRVLSSLALHHLSRDDRQRALIEIKRILAPGGELHVMDFSSGHMQHGHPQGHFRRSATETAHHPSISLEQAMVETGFSMVRKSGETNSVMGKIEYLSAVKAANRQSASPTLSMRIERNQAAGAAWISDASEH